MSKLSQGGGSSGDITITGVATVNDIAPDGAGNVAVTAEDIPDALVAADLDPYVVGPASATDNHLAVFDGTTGKLVKDGGPIPSGGGSALITVGAIARNIVSGNFNMISANGTIVNTQPSSLGNTTVLLIDSAQTVAVTSHSIGTPGSAADGVYVLDGLQNDQNTNVLVNVFAAVSGGLATYATRAAVSVNGIPSDTNGNIPVDIIPELADASTGTTNVDTLLVNFGLTPVDFTAGSTLPLPSTLKSQTINAGEAARSQWLCPDPPTPGTVLAALEMTVSSPSGVAGGGEQLIALFRSDGITVPAQPVASGTGTPGFLPSGFEFFKDDSAASDQILRFELPGWLDVAAGDISVGIVSLAAAPGATLPDLIVSDINWLWVDVATQSAINAGVVQSGFYADYMTLSEVSTSGMPAQLDGLSCPSPSIIWEANQTADPTENAFYLYTSGSPSTYQQLPHQLTMAGTVVFVKNGGLPGDTFTVDNTNLFYEITMVNSDGTYTKRDLDSYDNTISTFWSSNSLTPTTSQDALDELSQFIANGFVTGTRSVSSDTTMVSGDTVLLCSPNIGDMTVTIPNATICVQSRTYTIKRSDDGTSGFIVSIDASGTGASIDGLTNMSLGPYGEITIVNDNVHWFMQSRTSQPYDPAGLLKLGPAGTPLSSIEIQDAITEMCNRLNSAGIPGF